ncbi:hypothetical protein F8388_002844 [Cannabis sativa]|uniref:Uncharacterized protein n=1 Tax=Cannabis sativa TaxID=3483 RepID=A0A7J6FJQ8_CANSA|nr:hypothetical protein F8388_002844 [Cannabis sativa]
MASNRRHSSTSNPNSYCYGPVFASHLFSLIFSLFHNISAVNRRLFSTITNFSSI